MSTCHSKEADAAYKVCMPLIRQRLSGQLTQEELEKETAKITPEREEGPMPLKAIRKVFPGAKIERGFKPDDEMSF